MKKFLKGIRGKQVLVSVLALMVIASGVYRWSVSRNEAETVAVTTETLPVEEVKTSGDTAEPEETDFFALSRYERDCARSEAVELLTVSAEFEEENGSVAKKIEKHAQNAENETAIETMVKSKGFEDCVAFVGDEGVRVIVKATGLDSSGVAKIKDIVIETTGVKPTAIKISNRN